MPSSAPARQDVGRDVGIWAPPGLQRFLAQDSRVLLRNLILRESDSKAVTRLYLPQCSLRQARCTLDLFWEGRCKATWKREFKLPWREAGPPNHLHVHTRLPLRVVHFGRSTCHAISGPLSSWNHLCMCSWPLCALHSVDITVLGYLAHKKRY